MNKPKIIGTGLTGLVGTRIVELLNNKFEFIDLSLDSGVNLLDPQSLKNAFESNKDAVAIIHLAAYTDTNSAWEQRDDKESPCYKVNVLGTQNIFNLAKEYNMFFLYVSTDFVFDGNKTTSYTEADTPTPIEWYGQTKYLGEKILLDSDYKNFNISRITYPFRAKFDTKPDIVRKVIAKLENGEVVKMFDDQICTYTFIDDIAAAFGYFLENKTKGTYHVVGSSSHSPFEMCQIIADVFGFDKSLIEASSLDQYIASQPQGSRPWQKTLITSNQKLQDLGVKMHDLKSGLEEMKKQLS